MRSPGRVDTERESNSAGCGLLARDTCRGYKCLCAGVDVTSVWSAGPGRVRRRKRHDPPSPRWGCRAHNNSAIQRRRPIMKMRRYRAIFVALVTTTSWLVAEAHDQTSSRSSSGLSGPEGNPWGTSTDIEAPQARESWLCWEIQEISERR